jgi:hypothetical protein
MIAIAQRDRLICDALAVDEGAVLAAQVGNVICAVAGIDLRMLAGQVLGWENNIVGFTASDATGEFRKRKSLSGFGSVLDGQAGGSAHRNKCRQWGGVGGLP